jgi:hypothetical protein
LGRVLAGTRFLDNPSSVGYIGTTRTFKARQSGKLYEEKAPQQKKRLGDILCEAGLITQDQLKEALDEHRRSGKRLGEILIQLKIATESAIAQTLSRQLGFPYYDLMTVSIEPEAIGLIPEALAKKHQAIPIAIESTFLLVAFADPLITSPSGILVSQAATPSGRLSRHGKTSWKRSNGITILIPPLRVSSKILHASLTH